MEGVSAFLGIDFDESLVAPSFNGLPADDNSSFQRDTAGVSAAPATERRSQLSDDEAALIESSAADRGGVCSRPSGNARDGPADGRGARAGPLGLGPRAWQNVLRSPATL